MRTLSIVGLCLLVPVVLGAGFNVNVHRFDPYKTYKFSVKWDNRRIVGVSKISGLKRFTEPIIHRDGSEPMRSRVSPGTWKYEPIILERGITHDHAFEDWANLVHNISGDAAMSLKNFRKDIMIDLFNAQGKLVMSYKVYRCWVSRYEALPDLDANGETVAVERIVLQNEGWERDKSVPEPQES